MTNLMNKTAAQSEAPNLPDTIELLDGPQC